MRFTQANALRNVKSNFVVFSFPSPAFRSPLSLILPCLPLSLWGIDRTSSSASASASATVQQHHCHFEFHHFGDVRERTQAATEREREKERERVSERECERESVCLLLPMHLRSSTHSVASSSVCLSHCLRATGHAALPTRRRCTVAEIALLCAHFFKY